MESSITGVAARSAIPGDALYQLKTGIESTRLSIAQDAGDRAQLKMSFAEQRFEEIEALISEGRYREVSEAVLAFESDIHGALMELETVSQIDPARGTHIALEIVSALTRYTQILSTLIANAPESVKPDVVRALDTIQIASGLDLTPRGSLSNDNSNVNANDNSDDNGNDNANVNANDNSNDNANDDEDANSNEDNANVNCDDDNSNEDCINGNGTDDNANGNGTDDNANGNGTDDNANGNSNDDNGGSANDNSGGSEQ